MDSFICNRLLPRGLRQAQPTGELPLFWVGMVGLMLARPRLKPGATEQRPMNGAALSESSQCSPMGRCGLALWL